MGHSRTKGFLMRLVPLIFFMLTFCFVCHAAWQPVELMNETIFYKGFSQNADMDGDGIQELLTCRGHNGASMAVEIWKYDTETQTWNVVDSITNLDYDPVDVGVGDFNEDGNMDIVVALRFQGFRLYLNNGPGNWTEVFINGTYGNQVEVLDFDQDGHLDVFGLTVTGVNKIFYGDGQGNLISGPAPVEAAFLMPKDINNDGFVDLIGKARLGASVFIGSYINEGNRVWSTLRSHSSLFKSQSWKDGTDDLNNDGYIDIATDIYEEATDERKLIVFWGNVDNLNNLTWTVEEIDILASGIGNQNSSWSIPVNDVNGDGFLDIALGGKDNYPGIRIYYGDGQGSFSDPETLAQEYKASRVNTAVDYNNDNIKEIVFSNIQYPINSYGLGIAVSHPRANAGVDQSVAENSIVTLNAEGSEGFDLTYQWEQIAGPTVDLDLSDPIRPEFTTPIVPTGGATLTLKLTVTEINDLMDSDEVDITVTNVNNKPIADAGDDQLDPGIPEGEAVLLDGSNSYDLDNEPLACQWTQIAGTTVVITPLENCQATFTAPVLVPVEGELMEFELIVNDGIEDSEPDYVQILIIHINQPPVADAGGPGPLTRYEFSIVTLDGSASYDPENNPLAYQWDQISGPTVMIENAHQAIAQFTAPAVQLDGEDFVFQLTVDDAEYVDTDEVIVHVQNINDPPNCNEAVPSSFSLWSPNHKMKLISIDNLADPQSDELFITIEAVTQDEPVNGLGDGDTSPDAVVNYDDPQEEKVYIRSERSGQGNGRVYEVHFTASDNYESCSGSVNVTVPHNRKGTSIDDGQDYDSLQE
ncbi:MAG: FG-GAP-like repeat-containing protein [Candidatus Omnitrophica bacterium]|nr:FG-GAP-like repeat-containing protein [Candidatus Omnitrophota bacterium]